MSNWIKWNGGECPIKSDKTRVHVKFRIGSDVDGQFGVKWYWKTHGANSDIIEYRITEDHEPKMTREQITAQIEALQKQLDKLPVVMLRRYWDGNVMTSDRYPCDTHYFEIETINGIPHIHGVAMKEVGK